LPLPLSWPGIDSSQVCFAAFEVCRKEQGGKKKQQGWRPCIVRDESTH
jgi:hypothetical protein